jgi:hypothetical protein
MLQTFIHATRWCLSRGTADLFNNGFKPGWPSGGSAAQKRSTREGNVTFLQNVFYFQMGMTGQSA